MKRFVSTLAVAAICLSLASGVFADKEEKKGKDKVGPALNFTMDSIDGKPVKLADYQGKVVLMVNVASQCGNTPQYEQLEGLHEKYGEKGLAVLGFPANEFGKQEPGSNKEIAEFCKKDYGVEFPMFAKVVVKGKEQCDLYKFLTDNDKKPVAWNFEKFLVNKKGEVVARFKHSMKPDDPTIVKAIEAELAKE